MLKNLLLFVCLFLCAIPALSATPQQQSQEKLDFTLSTKKLSYIVGEPIDLTYTITNHLNSVITGQFELRTALNNVQVLYRNSPNAEFSALTNFAPASAGPLQTSFDSIVPNDSRAATERFVFDNNKNGLILTAPGTYQFQVNCQTSSNAGKIVLSSNIIQLTVNPLPASEQMAFQSWNEATLLRFIQNKTTDETQLSQGFNRAQSFLQSYPNSIYTPAVKASMVNYLNSKSSSLTNDERQLLNDLGRHKE